MLTAYTLILLILKSEKLVNTTTISSNAFANSGFVTAFNSQRKIVYAAGRIWTLLAPGDVSAGNDLYLVSAPTSIENTWSNSGEVKSSALWSCSYASLCFDGTYFHLAYLDGELYYRRGTPSSDGTVSWSVVDTVLTRTDGADVIQLPHIIMDSGNLPWIGYVYRDSVGLTRRPWANKSSTNDGTWTDAVGFPNLLQALANVTNVRSVPVALSTNQVLMLWSDDSTKIQAMLYNGAGWDAQEVDINDNTVLGEDSFDAVADSNDIVHIVYRTILALAHKLYYLNRSAAGVWSSETLIASDTNQGLHGAVSIDDNDRLYIIATYGGGNSEGLKGSASIEIYRLWDSSASWTKIDIVTSENSPSYPSMAVAQYNYKIFFTWSAYPSGTTWGVSPFDLRISAIPIPRPQIQTISCGI
mgnify:CR=1 FL=1